MHQKVNVMVFFKLKKLYAQKEKFREISSCLTFIPFFFLYFLVDMKTFGEGELIKIFKTAFLYHGFKHLQERIFFCISTTKIVGP